MSNDGGKDNRHKFDIGDNLTKILTSIFEPLIGENRIIAATLSIGVIVLIVSAVLLRDDNLVLGLVFGVILIIIPPSFLILIRHQEQKGGIKNEIQKLVIIACQGSKTRVVPQAEIIVTGAPKGATGKTNKRGEWIYKYPYYYVSQNQLVHIRASKTGIGSGEVLDYPLSARTTTLSINLGNETHNLSNHSKSLTETINPQDLPIQNLEDAPVTNLPIQSKCKPILQPNQVDTLVDCIIYGGRISQIANRRAFCLAVGIDTGRFNGLSSDADDAFARLTIEYDSQNPSFLLRICAVAGSSLPKGKQAELLGLVQHIKSCVSED